MAKRGRPTNAELERRAAAVSTGNSTFVPIPTEISINVEAKEVPAVVQFCEKAGWPLEALKEFEDLGVWLVGKNRQGEYVKVKR